MSALSLPGYPLEPVQHRDEDEDYEVEESYCLEEEDTKGRWTDWDVDLEDRWTRQEVANRDVDAYTTSEIDSRVYIRNVPNKGRCLFTRYALKPGDVVFVEAPILSCTRKLDPKLWKAISEDCKKHNTDADMPASWHHAAIYSLLYLDSSAKKEILDKWHPTVDKAQLSTDVVRICNNVKYARGLDPFEYERMLNAWRYNCFGHHTDVHGLVCYHRISMMAHSCESSATWHYGTQDDQFVLRARHHLPKDSEITITYVGDDELLKCKDTRRDRLSSWLFVCKCNKCSEPIDKARGIRCPSCGCGVTNFTTDDQRSVLEGDGINKVTVASPCTACLYVPTEEEMTSYLQFEEAYISRLDDCSTADMVDCETVLVEASRVMISHWVLNELYSILHNGYKALMDWDATIYFLNNKIDYVVQVSPSPAYQLAWLYEELGDDLIYKHFADHNIPVEGSYWDLGDSAPELEISRCTKNQITRAYENAMNVFLASCGDAHTYTLTSHWKMEYISSITPIDPTPLQEDKEA